MYRRCGPRVQCITRYLRVASCAPPGHAGVGASGAQLVADAPCCPCSGPLHSQRRQVQKLGNQVGRGEVNCQRQSFVTKTGRADGQCPPLPTCRARGQGLPLGWDRVKFSDGTSAIRSASARRRSLRSAFSILLLFEFWEAKNLQKKLPATGAVHQYSCPNVESSPLPIHAHTSPASPLGGVWKREKCVAEGRSGRTP